MTAPVAWRISCEKIFEKLFRKEVPVGPLHEIKISCAEFCGCHPGGPEADAAGAGSPRYSATRPSAPASAASVAQAATRAAAPDASSTADTASQRLRGVVTLEDGDDAGLRRPAWPRLAVDGPAGELGRGRDLDRERGRARGRLSPPSSSEDAVVVVDGNGSVSWASIANLNKPSQKKAIIFGIPC